MEAADDPAFALWLDALERRHLAELSFAEVRRALQALSSIYVERRDRLGDGAALGSAGKRAAFALFYGPLHYLTVRSIVRQLGAAAPPPRRIVDLGCGSGAAGAAWALAGAGRSTLAGVDANRFAVEETRWAWRTLGLAGRVEHGGLDRVRLAGAGTAIVVAYTVNELGSEPRALLLARLLEAAGRGARVLVVEPIASRVVPWWEEWAARVERGGGRSDLWRFRAVLPERLQAFDRAAGLNHQELTARSLYLASRGVKS